MSVINVKTSIVKYRPDIDGLRAIAVISVLIFHAFPNLIPGGFIGVDIFFVISGYLISNIIFEKINNDDFSFLDFYFRRIKRIFPALLLVMIFCIIFGWLVLLSDEFRQLGKHIAAGTAFVSNLVLWSEHGYFDTSSDTKILLHLWSLGIEEQFYLIWPFLIWIAYKLKINWIFVILGCGCLSFFLNVFQINENPTATFYSPLSRLWEMLFGSVLSYFLINKHIINKYLINFDINKVVRLANFSALLGIVFVFTGLLTTTHEKSFPGFWALLPTLGTFMIIFAGPETWINKKILSNRLLVWVGLISYPLYLWHWPVLTFARILESETPTSTVRFFAIIASLILATLTYKFIETPIRHSQKKMTIIILITSGLILGLLGSLVYKFDGLKFRDPTNNENYNNLKVEQRFNESCSLNFKNIPSTHCAEVGQGNDIAIIIGDSHVRHWFGILKNQLISQNYKVIAISKGDCPFFLDVKNDKISDCLPANNEIFDNILKNQKSIKLIFLAGQFSNYTDVEFLKNIDGSPFDFGIALDRTLKKLPNIKTIFLDQVPPITFDPKKCIYRPYRISKFDFECKTDRKLIISLFANYKAIKSKVLSGHSLVSSFDIDNILCDENLCKAMSDNFVLYYDNSHLNPVGVKYIADKVNLKLDGRSK